MSASMRKMPSFMQVEEPAELGTGGDSACLRGGS
ncbi:unnamed protein product [Penicillium roqueforti FM164]|uniref:Genomic scaffold, ProqFM164S01 n=1 Tax=Penicillium roqueforti (strain FM164) TaxID=1365484 RepID=W6PYL8_PENRF|nr:unnamed protein product [Penicillium roqueforti FM164]